MAVLALSWFLRWIGEYAGVRSWYVSVVRGIHRGTARDLVWVSSWLRVKAWPDSGESTLLARFCRHGMKVTSVI